MTGQLGYGLISVGWMGRLHSVALQRSRLHYRELDVRPRFVIAADPVADHAQFAVDVLGYESSTADWRDVILHSEVEAVSIAAPNAFHREIAVFAAEHGKHIWIEKPAGLGLADATDIATAVARAGVRSTVGYNYRHVPAVAAIRRMIADGELGRITHARGYFLADYAADPAVALTWRFSRELGGAGVIDDLMSHVVDLLTFLVGPISEVAATEAIVVAQRPRAAPGAAHFARGSDSDLGPVENPDLCSAVLRFQGGAIGSAEVGRVSVGHPCGLGFEIGGTDGFVSWNFERMLEFAAYTRTSAAVTGVTRVSTSRAHGDYARFQPGPAIAMSYDDLKVIEAAGFVRLMQGETSDNASADDALAVARVLDAIARASQTRSWCGTHGATSER